MISLSLSDTRKCNRFGYTESHFRCTL